MNLNTPWDHLAKPIWLFHCLDSDQGALDLSITAHRLWSEVWGFVLLSLIKINLFLTNLFVNVAFMSPLCHLLSLFTCFKKDDLVLFFFFLLLFILPEIGCCMSHLTGLTSCWCVLWLRLMLSSQTQWVIADHIVFVKSIKMGFVNGPCVFLGRESLLLTET